LEHCPSDSLRQMLLKGLPHAFGGRPHAYQLEFAKLLRKSLEQEQNLQVQAQEKCATEESEIKSQLEAGHAELAATAERVQAARAVVEERASELTLKQEASKAEEVQHSEAKAAKEAAVLEHQKLEQLKAEADSVANGSLQMLLNGGWEDKESCADFVSGVYEYMMGMNCEGPLLAALPKALGRRPDERGEFDKIVLEEVVRIMEAKVKSSTDLVEQEKEKIEDFNATDLGAWAIWDIACDLEKAAVSGHEQAQGELQVKLGEQNAADAKVAATNALLEKACGVKAVTDSKVEEIVLSLGELQRLESLENENSEEVPAPSPKRRKLDVEDIEVHVQPDGISA